MSRKTYSKKFKNSNYGTNYPANLELAVEIKFPAPANPQNNNQKGFVCLIYKASNLLLDASSMNFLCGLSLQKNTSAMGAFSALAMFIAQTKLGIFFLI